MVEKEGLAAGVVSLGRADGVGGFGAGLVGSGGGLGLLRLGLLLEVGGACFEGVEAGKLDGWVRGGCLVALGG